MTEADRKAYNNPNLSQTLEERVRAILYSLTNDPDYDGWDTSVLAGVKVISVSVGKCEFEMDVTKAMCNKADMLHGGCSSTLLDNLSSAALLTIAKPGFLEGGSVSRTMTFTYLRPVPRGTKIRLVCEAVSGGKNTAHCKGDIRTLDGKICVTCTHDKAVVQRGFKANL